MSKKYTRKEKKLIARAARRRHSLKTNPQVFGKKVTVEEQNHAVIKSLEAKVKAAQAEG